MTLSKYFIEARIHVPIPYAPVFVPHPSGWASCAIGVLTNEACDITAVLILSNAPI